MRNKASYIWCFASGVASGLCLLFPTFGPAIFLFPAVALAVIFQQDHTKKLLLLCGAFALGLCMCGYAPALTIKAAVKEDYIFLTALAVYIVVPIVHTPLLAGAIWLGCRLSTSKLLRPVTVALMWGTVEWLLGTGPFAWPTLRLSLALWQYPALIRTASLGGQLLVSVIIMAVAAFLAEAAVQKEKMRVVSLLMAAILFVSNALFGLCYPAVAEGAFSVAVVQPGSVVIGEKRGDVYQRAFVLAQEAAEYNVDMILLPESVLPIDFYYNSSLQEKWLELANASGSHLFACGNLNEVSTLYHISPEDSTIGTYQKIKEVPIFESGFKSDSFERLPQEQSNLLYVGETCLGAMICYESMISSLSSQAAQEGARLLIVPTNDSWFDCDSAKRLHLAHSVFRAVESGRPLVQAGLNGCSAVVDQSGSIMCSLPAGDRGLLTAQCDLDVADTCYLKIGDSWLLISMIAVMTLALYKRKTVKREE